MFALLAACGDDAPPAPQAPTVPGRTWSFATIEGVERLSDIAVMEDELVAVADGGDRNVYAVDLRDLKDGRTLRARVLDMDLHEDAPISGSEPFARESYTIAHVWELPVSFVGIARRPPNGIYVVERTHRLMYWGQTVDGADGKLVGVRLNWAYTMRGGLHNASSRSDWRDHGPGVKGLSALRGARRVEDLYAIDGDGGTPTTVGLRRLDRTGGQMGPTVRITSAAGLRPDVRSVVLEAHADRFLALVGNGRGALVPFQDAGARTVRLGNGTPGPKREGVTGWTSLEIDERGTLYLLSQDSPPVLAWREAPAKKKKAAPKK